MSKWEKIKDQFPKLQSMGDTKYIDKVQEKRFEYAELPLKDLIERFGEFKKQRDELEDQAKALNPDIEALSGLLIEHLETQGFNSVKTDEGRTLYIQVEPHVSVVDREVLDAHVDAHPDLSYLKGVIWQSLNTLVKDLLEQGKDDEIPPGIKIFMKSSARLRK